MFARAIANFRPRPRIRTLDWARENVQTHEGRPYDAMAYPHLGAPGGPMDAFDCPQYLTIWLQWASRLGKTFFGQCAQLKSADTDPCPMMFASADEKLATEVTARSYRMLDLCPPLRGQLRPKSRRRQSLVDLDNCRIYVAWARSVSTLADKAVRIGHANEIDKWEHTSTSKEADPLELFADRFKEFPTHKKIFESTPATKHTSRIERGRLGSTNAAYFVPCPECRRYQVLRMDRIKWDKSDAGKSDKDLARNTARYICQHCEAELRDEHRGPMMRAGVWIPEGCGCDDEQAREAAEAWRQPDRPAWRGWSESDWITGTPARNGRDYGSQLGSIVALSLSWGEIAAKWVEVQRNPQNFRNFVNQWLGETWEIVSRKETWEKVGERLVDAGSPRGVVPLWASLLTCAVDRQGRDGGKFPWIVLAWGPENRCHVVCYGECDTFDQVEQQVIKATYPHADGRATLRISYALCDSGFVPLGVYEFCIRLIKQGFDVWPAKGSNTAMNSDFAWSTLGENTSMPGMRMVMVDTIRSQLWLESRLFDDTERRQTTIHSGSIGEHEDFLVQILNDAAVSSTDSHNNARESWKRIDESIPNDYRDVWRYAWCARQIFQGGRDILPRTYTAPHVQESAKDTGRIRQLRIRR